MRLEEFFAGLAMLTPWGLLPVPSDQSSSRGAAGKNFLFLEDPAEISFGR